jgi:hypothetical protein
LFKRRLKQIAYPSSFEEQLSIYQAASIVRWAVLEAAALIILFLKPDVILFGIIIILYLAFIRPTEESVKGHIQNSVQ